MPKVTGPIQIEGTFDDLTFYRDQDGTNLVKRTGRGAVSPHEFRTSPKYEKVRNHGQEFGRVGKIAVIFRRLAHAFNERAKDYSYPGRVTKLLLEILQEDTQHTEGSRTLACGMLEPDVAGYLEGFEGNKFRPLAKVLWAPWQWNTQLHQLEILGFEPGEHLNWPEEATHVEIGVARSRWDFENRNFTTQYSEEVLLAKTESIQDVLLPVAEPEGKGWELCYIFVGFHIKERKRMKPLKRIHNTVSLFKVVRCE